MVAVWTMSVQLQGLAVGGQEAVIHPERVLPIVQGMGVDTVPDRASRFEALFECLKGGNAASADLCTQIRTQGLFALGAGRQGENADAVFARRTRLQVAVHVLPDGAVGGVRQQVLAQLRVTECLRLAGQGANEVAVVDAARPLMVDGIDPRQSDRPGRADEGLDTVVEDVQA